MFVWLFPEPSDQRTQQQVLYQAHAGMGRHFESAQFDQAKPSGWTVGRVKLVNTELGTVGVAGHIDQQVAQQPVNQPWSRDLTLWHLLKGDFELVEGIVARLVDAGRLAGRANKHPREEIGQPRVVLPVGDQAAQQIRSAQDRAIGRSLSTNCDMVTTTSS